MPYLPPQGSVDFEFSGTPYVRSTAAVANFDGSISIAFAPPPKLQVSQQALWQKALTSERTRTSRFGKTLTIETLRTQTSHQGQPLNPPPFGVLWGKVPELEQQLVISHGTAPSKKNSSEGSWTQPPAADKNNASEWDQSIQAKELTRIDDWKQAPEKDNDSASLFQSVDLYNSTSRKPPAYVLPQPPISFVFQESLYSESGTPAAWFRFGAIEPNTAIQPTDTRQRSFYSSNRTQDEPVIIPWGEGRKQKDNDYTGKYGGETRPEDPKKPQPKQPDIRESYLLMNTISVVILPDRTPIEIRDLDISLDIDSFSWSFTGSLWGASSLALVEPDQDGVKQIEVDINGWKWVFIIERYTSNRAFGQERYTIYGTSRTQLLAAPYAPQRSKSNTSQINAKQAISEELKNTGFTAEYPDLNDYSTPDWIIPGGSFSYQNETPMKVIARLTGTAGSVIIPARNSDTLNIQPRYPASPWKWSEATMDKIIPASLVISLSASWRPEPEYNAVYVSGTHTGVAVNVKRTGSAGNDPAPDILEDWLTETQVNTERGRNELAKGGHQSVVTLEIPLTANSITPGLVVPGQLAEVQDTVLGESQSWRALCLSTSIRVSSGKVVQVIELERHYLSSSSQQPTPPQPETVNLLDSLGGNGGSDWSKWDHWNNLYYWGSGNTQEEATVNGIICTVGRGTNTQSNSTYVFYYRTLAFEKDKKYTVSLWLKGDSATTPYVDCYINSFLGGGQHEVGTGKVVKGSELTITDAWTQYIWTFTCTEETPADQGGVAFALRKQPADVEIQWAMPVVAEGDLSAEEVQSHFSYTHSSED